MLDRRKYLYILPLSIVLVGAGSGIEVGGILGRTVEAEDGVG